MKKEVKEYKTICDCCGKEVDDNKKNKFVLPVFTSEDKYAMNKGKPAIMFTRNVLAQRECDLCEEDQKKIAFLLHLRSCVTIDETGMSFKLPIE